VLRADFKCADHDYDAQDCCPGRQSCGACAGDDAAERPSACVWCETADGGWRDPPSLCLDRAEQSKYFCGDFAYPQHDQRACDAREAAHLHKVRKTPS
jgi:hypothetical protein